MKTTRRTVPDGSGNRYGQDHFQQSAFCQKEGMLHKAFYLLRLLVLLVLAACSAQSDGADDLRPQSDTVQVNHDGISFTYDPALLDQAVIRDMPPSAADGLFGQPTPAHTWIGLGPTSDQQLTDSSWLLIRQPQVIVFDLADFGSFAMADSQARERLVLFQGLMADRPAVFAEEIPVLPPINAAQVIQAQIKWLDFRNGSGVRFITQYDQDYRPINNEGLTYIFFGLTTDGLHGITAVFPIRAAGLRDDPLMSDEAFAAFLKKSESELATATQFLNDLPDGDFTPTLSQLDSLVQSITVRPTDNDFAMVTMDPIYGQVIKQTTIFTSPNDELPLGALQAGEAVVVNATSADGRRHRIQCPDRTTGNCWLPAERIQVSDAGPDDPVFSSSGMPAEGQVVEVTAVVDNAIYAKPADRESGTASRIIGTLLAGESIVLYGADETGQWLNIECPRGIGVACWITSDEAVNRPTGFFSSDGQQDDLAE